MEIDNTWTNIDLDRSFSKMENIDNKSSEIKAIFWQIYFSCHQIVILSNILMHFTIPNSQMKHYT